MILTKPNHLYLAEAFLQQLTPKRSLLKGSSKKF